MIAAAAAYRIVRRCHHRHWPGPAILATGNQRLFITTFSPLPAPRKAEEPLIFTPHFTLSRLQAACTSTSQTRPGEDVKNEDGSPGHLILHRRLLGWAGLGWAGVELLKFPVVSEFSAQSEYSSHTAAAAGGTSPPPLPAPAEAAPPQQSVP